MRSRLWDSKLRLKLHRLPIISVNSPPLAAPAEPATANHRLSEGITTLAFRRTISVSSAVSTPNNKTAPR